MLPLSRLKKIDTYGKNYLFMNLCFPKKKIFRRNLLGFKNFPIWIVIFPSSLSDRFKVVISKKWQKSCFPSLLFPLHLSLISPSRFKVTKIFPQKCNILLNQRIIKEILWKFGKASEEFYHSFIRFEIKKYNFFSQETWPG